MRISSAYIYPKGNPYIFLNLSINNICGYVKKKYHKIFGNMDFVQGIRQVLNKSTLFMNNKHIEITFRAPYNGRYRG